MKIDSNSPAVNLVSTDYTAKPAPKTGVNGASSAAEDRTTFSSAGTLVHSLTAQAMNTPPVRQAKVDALRQQVQNGTYQLDPKKIAEAMIDHLGE